MSGPNQASTNGLSAKDAAVRAATYLKELLPESGRISIEEVESDEKDGNWLITLGFAKPAPFLSALEAISGGPREYKVFKVDRQSGVVVWMRMR